MKIRKQIFNSSVCITEVALNEFVKEKKLRREDIINITPVIDGIVLWYWELTY